MCYQFFHKEGTLFITKTRFSMITIGRMVIPSMAIPLLANQDLTPMLVEAFLGYLHFKKFSLIQLLTYLVKLLLSRAVCVYLLSSESIAFSTIQL